MKNLLLTLSVCLPFMLKATILIDPVGNGGFETGTTFALNGWTSVNGAQTNKWFVGNTGVPFAGARCVYVSDNAAGTTYNYNLATTSVVHFYRDVTFPAGETNIQLSFRWKGQGESCCDYIQAFLVPTSTVPAAGTQLFTGQLGVNLNLQGAYTIANFTLPCSAAGTTMRLVFSYRNDGSLGTQPPGAIDNISLTSNLPGACALGTGGTVIGSLPYASGAGTTCGAVDDFTSSNVTACGSTSYLTGEDRVWQFTPTASGDITITLTSAGSYTGLMLYNGCPSCGTCVANAQSSTGDKTMCATVVAGQTYYLILDSWASPTCNAYSNLQITAPSGGFTSCNLAYTVSSIAYAPEAWATGTTVPGSTTDDIFSSAYIPSGFNFCYNGQTNITQALISANGYIIFDSPSCIATNLAGGSSATPSAYSGYVITSNIPNTTEAPRNAILGAWMDMDPSVGGTIRTNATGAAPNRIFTAKWDNVPMFSAACNALLARCQIRLFEQNNVIEVHIGNKPSCPTWNSDYAIIGLHAYDGLSAVVPANRNAIPAWPSTTNEAWRFIPDVTCTACRTLPLEITNFKGNMQKNDAYLQWDMGDMNAKTLTLEHSADGYLYYPVGTQEYKGVGAYQQIDHNPIPGRNFYRVYAETKDGGYVYGKSIELTYSPNVNTTSILAIYPNPVTEDAKLDVYFPTQTNAELEIIDISGKVLKKESIAAMSGRFTITVDMKAFSNGIYYVRLHDGKMYSKTEKIIKN